MVKYVMIHCIDKGFKGCREKSLKLTISTIVVLSFLLFFEKSVGKILKQMDDSWSKNSDKAKYGNYFPLGCQLFHTQVLIDQYFYEKSVFFAKKRCQGKMNCLTVMDFFSFLATGNQQYWSLISAFVFKLYILDY